MSLTYVIIAKSILFGAQMNKPNKIMKLLTPIILLFLAGSASSEQLKEPIYTSEEVIGFIKDKYKVKPSHKLYKFKFNYIDQIFDVEFTPFAKDQIPTCTDCGQMFIVPNKENPIVRHPLHG
jgi:hypothetical protein